MRSAFDISVKNNLINAKSKEITFYSDGIFQTQFILELISFKLPHDINLIH